MKYEVLEKLRKDPKYLEFLRQNSYWYKKLNRNPDSYSEFIDEMKTKYKLRTIDKIDNIVDSADLISKILNITNQ